MSIRKGLHSPFGGNLVSSGMGDFLMNEIVREISLLHIDL